MFLVPNPPSLAISQLGLILIALAAADPLPAKTIWREKVFAKTSEMVIKTSEEIFDEEDRQPDADRIIEGPPTLWKTKLSR